MNLEEIKKLYAKKDSMHNWKHILRIQRNTKKILKRTKQKMDLDKLRFLINYHGLKEYVLKNKNKFTKEQIKSLLRHSKRPKIIEEKLVHDVNLLDNVGIRGIQKAFVVGKKIKRRREETLKYIQNNISKIKWYTLEGKRLGRIEIKMMKKAIKMMTP
jgi:HD superfamily phosphodiesterase